MKGSFMGLLLSVDLLRVRLPRYFYLKQSRVKVRLLFKPRGKFPVTGNLGECWFGFLDIAGHADMETRTGFGGDGRGRKDNKDESSERRKNLKQRHSFIKF